LAHQLDLVVNLLVSIWLGMGKRGKLLHVRNELMSRIDQITFDGEDVSWLSNLNADFLNMVSTRLIPSRILSKTPHHLSSPLNRARTDVKRWQHPKFASRHRQASSQLSSLASQNTDGQVRDRGEYDSQEEAEDEEDDGDGEIPRRLSNKRRNSMSIR
jgi:hypothetical protein